MRRGLADVAPGDGRAGEPEGSADVRRRAGWLRRLYLTLRTEHTTPGKVAAGTALGVFVGCSPFWGLHTAIVLLLATVFRLNRVLVYAATNVGNPLTAPALLFAEVQVGHRILRGVWLGLSLDEVRSFGLSSLFVDLVVGSLVVGSGLALVLGGVAWLAARAGRLPAAYQDIVDGIVRRYLDASILEAEKARFRLLRDPVFRVLLEEPACAGAARVLDVGCGRGLAAAVLAASPAAPAGGRSYVGVDESERHIRVARDVLSDLPGLSFQACDFRDFDPPPADLVLLVDVLHYLPHSSQDALLRRLGRAMPPGGRILLREVDASARARFWRAAIRDALSAFLPGRPHHVAHFRRAADLANALVASGFSPLDRSSRSTAARGKVLFEAVRRPAAAQRSGGPP
mgnify:CR=1 FL=1